MRGKSPTSPVKWACADRLRRGAGARRPGPRNEIIRCSVPSTSSGSSSPPSSAGTASMYVITATTAMSRQKSSSGGTTGAARQRAWWNRLPSSPNCSWISRRKSSEGSVYERPTNLVITAPRSPRSLMFRSGANNILRTASTLVGSGCHGRLGLVQHLEPLLVCPGSFTRNLTEASEGIHADSSSWRRRVRAFGPQWPVREVAAGNRCRQSSTTSALRPSKATTPKRQ